MTMNKLLYRGFINSVNAFPERPALNVAGATQTYRQLFQKAASLAATIAANEIDKQPPLTAVFARRSVTAFAGVLAALMRGHGYVPLNCTFPAGRTRTMLQRAGCATIIVDEGSEGQLHEVLTGLEQKAAVILPEREDIQEFSERWPQHRFIGAKALVPWDRWREAEVSSGSVAYLLFTSGSTGVPKGVMVTHDNVAHYINFVAERFSITEEDRFSQMFEMTFDLSAADMFVAWSRGACVCCPSGKALLNPGRFISDMELTVWFSVPSVPIFMKRLGGLKPGSYPKLRVSMFCGEALPVDIAKSWTAAAPNSIVENLYGPTELTIACMYYRWTPDVAQDDAELGLVPIGSPFPGMEALVIDEDLQEVNAGETGELLMTGPQVSAGYWADPEKTAQSFIVPPGKKAVFYRTGDRVRKPKKGFPMTYLGRTDNQIKILGHRVELAEIESVVREESTIEGVVALGWPIMPGGALGVEVFIEDAAAGLSDLKERIAGRLPGYMVPKRFHFLPEFPLNANGKYDRMALTKYLETLT